MVLLGIIVTPLMLHSNLHWDGRTTWFGNKLYGRMGNAHTPTNPTLFDQWYFLTVRNPVDNFSTEVLSVCKSYTWPWLVDQRIAGNFYILYGWKNPRDEASLTREFVFRPWFHK